MRTLFLSCLIISLFIVGCYHGPFKFSGYISYNQSDERISGWRIYTPSLHAEESGNSDTFTTRRFILTWNTGVLSGNYSCLDYGVRGDWEESTISDYSFTIESTEIPLADLDIRIESVRLESGDWSAEIIPPPLEWDYYSSKLYWKPAYERITESYGTRNSYEQVTVSIPEFVDRLEMTMEIVFLNRSTRQELYRYAWNQTYYYAKEEYGIPWQGD